MKRTLLAAVLLTGLLSLQAQERLSREEALKYAFFTSVNLNQMLQTPIPTDPDVKRPVAMRDDEQHGGMVLPEAKLSADTFAKAGTEVIRMYIDQCLCEISGKSAANRETTIQEFQKALSRYIDMA